MLDQALGWIGQIADWFGKFIPRWVIVVTTRKGVKFVRGSRVVICEPGIHWYWPAVTEWTDWPVVRQGETLAAQTIVTTDDKTITVGGMLIYQIVDVESFMVKAYSPVHLVQEIALTAVHDVCCSMSWEELKAEQRRGTLDTKLKNAAKSQLKEYGIEVIKCMLTDLAPCRVLKLIQSSITRQETE